ncbi:MAG: AbrB/MazE/SpoVT family DNA-binding domain-containing protein [Actinobacteria bacterium]|nr:AbrB/MazE/SpoVT family DNA-binding domain-containing protein [Actinomycetota bacterium]
MAHHQVEVQIGPQGRIVIPAELRRVLNLQPGEVVLARVEGDRLVLERRQEVLRRLKSRFDEVSGDISLAQELIADRRVEARRDGHS